MEGCHKPNSNAPPAEGVSVTFKLTSLRSFCILLLPGHNELKQASISDPEASLWVTQHSESAIAGHRPSPFRKSNHWSIATQDV